MRWGDRPRASAEGSAGHSRVRPAPRFLAFARCMPGISAICCQQWAALVSKHNSAYSYLPASVGAFPPPAEFARIIASYGFSNVEAVPLTFGIVYLYMPRSIEPVPLAGSYGSRSAEAWRLSRPADKLNGGPRSPRTVIIDKSLMYFNFDDDRPDTPRIAQPISRREVVLLTINIHALIVIAILLGPKLPWVREAIEQRQQEVAEKARQELERQRKQARFVFVQPRVDMTAPKPPPRAELSDLDRQARTVERAADADEPDAVLARQLARAIEAEAPSATRSAIVPRRQPTERATRHRRALRRCRVSRGADAQRRIARQAMPRGPAPGVIADAIRNVRQYAQQENFGNLRGGQDQTSASRFSSTRRASSSGPGWRGSSRRCAATG